MQIRSASKRLLVAAAIAATLTALPDLPRVSAQSSDSASAPTKAAGGKLSFDVASIKRDDHGTLAGQLNLYPGGRLVIPGFTLKSLICTAFDISYWQLSGGEDWIGKTVFDVEAKAPPNMAANINLRHSWEGIYDRNLRLMLQSLLIDRFQLKFHMETKPGTLYLLEKTGKTSPLQPAKTDKLFQEYGEGFSEASPQGGVWFLDNASMPQVANFLSTYIVRAPVVDKTGLIGTFDFRSKSPQDFSQDSGASAISGLAELGLKLKPQKGPVEYFVIDHAEQPSPN